MKGRPALTDHQIECVVYAVRLLAQNGEWPGHRGCPKVHRLMDIPESEWHTFRNIGLKRARKIMAFIGAQRNPAPAGAEAGAKGKE